MRRIKIAFWSLLVVCSVLWLVAEPAVLQPSSLGALRDPLLQGTGILAIAMMSVAMIFALRPRWPERWMDGLDKMYRFHKWLGIGGLILAVLHWLVSEAPKWLGGLGLSQGPARQARTGVPSADTTIVEQIMRSLHSAAEGIGEWAFYAAVVLIVAALVTRIPYRLFYKTHRLLAVVYLALVFHSVVLLKQSYWLSPIGLVMALLMAYGTFAAFVLLIWGPGAGRKADGTITFLHYYPNLHVMEGETDVPEGWPGHKAGQFAFVTSSPSEGAHPYTIASAWDPSVHKMTFITKELGDWTARLKETLQVGTAVKVEGPYGCFTFDDDCPRQIWIGGGIGITPFVARMKQLAAERHSGAVSHPDQAIDLFHTTADWNEEAIAKMRADAEASGVSLHVSHDARDGLLTGERIRAVVPEWREASLWFCGPTGFGAALKADFAKNGFPASQRFHQEIFSMR